MLGKGGLKKAINICVREATYTTPLKVEKDILHYFNGEMISVACSPKCGDCKCGSCALGSRTMSIADEKNYEAFKSLMHLEEKGSAEDSGHTG